MQEVNMEFRGWKTPPGRFCRGVEDLSLVNQTDRHLMSCLYFLDVVLQNLKQFICSPSSGWKDKKGTSQQ